MIARPELLAVRDIVLHHFSAHYTAADVSQICRAVGENIAKTECVAVVAASSWANTPEGQLAYAFAKVGGLGP